MNSNFIVLRSNYDPTTGNMYIVDGSKFDEINQHTATEQMDSQ